VSTARLADLPASPALIENAIRSSARIQGSEVEALAILKTGLSALGAHRTEGVLASTPFDPALSFADVDLTRLAGKVEAAPTKALSFLLSGAPGTGKSAYARYLAERLDLEVIERRYSDIASMFLGESEKAISEAFQEAADRRAFLIFDEADSLLRDRAAAHHSWEITQVNEMLTWMERHPYPFACTTNAADCLDPATARRFLFKVRFNFMNAEQISSAFLRTFETNAPDHILSLEGLTPGDFAVVARKANVLGERDVSRLAALLVEEMEAKPGRGVHRIGF
jgi:SpoVK/Ycf46/Vps4 family AAA+-type ATPase